MMISVDEAKTAIRKTLSPLGVETVPLGQAAGRILAEPVFARMTQPPFSSSAMDGYATRFADARKESARLRVVGTSSAGERFGAALPEGAAVRIFTGAPVPDGADHIVIQEETRRDGDDVIITEPQTSARNIRAKGVDFRNGDELITAGARLTGPKLALAAAGNLKDLNVRKRPRVALIANGDELVMPGATPGPDDIICSIPFALAPMIKMWGGDPVFLGVAADDKQSIRTLGEKALEFDLIVPVGGASVGEKDFMRAVFKELGYAPLFEKVAVRPGKPTWFGKVGPTHVLGLPGNPASAMVTAALFVKTAIAALLSFNAAMDANESFALTTGPLPENGPRESYLRAKLSHSADGALQVTAFKQQDSSLLSVMAQADVLIRRAANAKETPAGARVSCIAI